MELEPTTKIGETPDTETSPLAKDFNRSHRFKSINVQRKITTSTEVEQEVEMEQIQRLAQIYQVCESQWYMHRLAHQYFSYRHVMYNSVPVISITFASGIMAFLATADMVPASSKQYLSLSVGFLAIISTAVQSFNQEARYDSRAEIHKNAALGLKKILHTIVFTLLDPEHFSGSPSQSQSQKENTDSPVTETNVEQIPVLKESRGDSLDHACSKINDLYKQILESCQSQIPVKISQTFRMAFYRLSMTMTEEDKESVSKEFGRSGQMLLHQCLYHEVFCAITKYPTFPNSCPEPDKVVTEAMKVVEKHFQDRQVTFYRREEKFPDTSV